LHHALDICFNIEAPSLFSCFILSRPPEYSGRHLYVRVSPTLFLSYRCFSSLICSGKLKHWQRVCQTIWNDIRSNKRPETTLRQNPQSFRPSRRLNLVCKISDRTNLAIFNCVLCFLKKSWQIPSQAFPLSHFFLPGHFPAHFSTPGQFPHHFSDNSPLVFFHHGQFSSVT